MRRVGRFAPGLRVAAAALALMFAAMDAAWGQAPVSGPNYSSHAAPFFESLLAGRVWVLERPNSSRADDRGNAWAHYHAPDGTLLACAHLGGGYAAATARWRVVGSRAFRALYNYYEAGTEPDPGLRQGHTPIFYDPTTGRLHNETLSGETLGPETLVPGVWTVASRGWVQESWPAAMREACPDLALPKHLRVNRSQTATGFEAMMAQDLAAPLRNAPGSHLRGPGATGIAAARGRDRLPAAELARFLAENDGFVLTDTAGARHVLVLGVDGDELWLLSDDGEVADTGLLVPAAGGAEIAVHYGRLPIRPRYRVGDALPFLPTGERFAAMRITDRLSQSGEAVALPISGTSVSGPRVPGRGETVVRFFRDGTLTARGGDSRAGDAGEVAGSWRWSRGELVVTLQGAGGEVRVFGTSVPWRVLADLVGRAAR